MNIETREATSTEMQKNIKIVKKMSGGMGFDENMNKVHWKAIRWISNIGYMFMPKEKGIRFTNMRIDGRKCIIAEPLPVANTDIILYIHGGGFVSGSAAASKAYCSMLAKYSGSKVVALDYALSPENKYPIALNDCVSVYSQLQKDNLNVNIIITGESAGASLALASTLRIISSGMKTPKCLIVHSPFVDFGEEINRNIHTIDDFTVKEGCFSALRDIYVGKTDVAEQTVSPINGDYRNFPPLFITCDSNETLYGDAIALYKKAELSGDIVRMIEMKNAFHAFAVIGTGTPETKQILIDSVEFIRSFD